MEMRNSSPRSVAFILNVVNYAKEGLNEEETHDYNTEDCMCIVEQLNQLAMQHEGAEEISRRGKPLPRSFVRISNQESCHQKLDLKPHR